MDKPSHLVCSQRFPGRLLPWIMPDLQHTRFFCAQQRPRGCTQACILYTQCRCLLLLLLPKARRNTAACLFTFACRLFTTGTSMCLSWRG